MDAWASIDAAMRMENAMNLFGQFAIFSLVGTGFTLKRVIVATDGNQKHTAHATYRIELGMFFDEGIAQLWAREKMASAFFRMSRSCRVTSNSRFKRRISSSPAAGFPLPTNAFSPAWLNSLHQ